MLSFAKRLGLATLGVLTVTAAVVGTIAAFVAVAATLRPAGLAGLGAIAKPLIVVAAGLVSAGGSLIEKANLIQNGPKEQHSQPLLKPGRY